MGRNRLRRLVGSVLPSAKMALAHQAGGGARRYGRSRGLSRREGEPHLGSPASQGRDRARLPGLRASSRSGEGAFLQERRAGWSARHGQAPVGGSGVFGRAAESKGRRALAAGISRSPRAEGLSPGRRGSGSWGVAARVGAGGVPGGYAWGGAPGPEYGEGAAAAGGRARTRGAERAPGREAVGARGACTGGPGGAGPGPGPGPPEHVRRRGGPEGQPASPPPAPRVRPPGWRPRLPAGRGGGAGTRGVASPPPGREPGRAGRGGAGGRRQCACARGGAAAGRGERTKPASRRGTTGSGEGQNACGKPNALKGRLRSAPSSAKR